MTTQSTASTAVTPPHQAIRWQHTLLAGLIGLTALACVKATQAADLSHYPITAGQRSTAQQVAQAGVPLSALTPNAPERYTIKRGDTLWDISALYLNQPWRWPELWGMNLQQIQNPHLIFPGQVLVLTRIGDRAVLSFDQSGLPTTRLSPRIRAESLADAAIAPIPLHVIEPFLTESLIVDGATHERAPRIVAAPENRVLLSRGDRAYARGQYGSGDTLEGSALLLGKGQSRFYRVYRNAVALKDPATGEVLGYEAQFIGKAALAREESTRTTAGDNGSSRVSIEPATIDITQSKEEMRVGDRLLPEPARDIPSYVPHAPASGITGQIVKVHGNAVQFAGQNQVVILNRGTKDGLERGHVLAIQKDANVVTDTTDNAKPQLQLPGERNGQMMVFRTFDRVSYALVLQITDGVKVGDHFTTP